LRNAPREISHKKIEKVSTSKPTSVANMKYLPTVIDPFNQTQKEEKKDIREKEKKRDERQKGP
jgi:hypothetical protein